MLKGILMIDGMLKCKICLTLHQWSHPRWGTLLPCCRVNISAPHFSCRTRAAISHVPALVPTICFDHSLIVLAMLWQQHSPSISQCFALNRRFLFDMTEWCMPALRALHHAIGLQSTNTHSAHSLASFPLARATDPCIQKPAGTRKAAFPSLSWRADKLGHPHSGHSPTSPNKDILILPVYLSLPFYLHATLFHNFMSHVSRMPHFKYYFALCIPLNLYLSWILCLICILLSLMYSLCLYVILFVYKSIFLCVYMLNI